MSEKLNLFSTPLWTSKVNNNRLLNRKLMMDCLDYKADQWNYLDLPGEGIDELRQFVISSATNAANDYGIEFKEIKYRARQHVRKPLECDIPHNHPNTDLLGVYYVTAPDKCGDILLHDTRGFVTDIWQDPNVKDPNDNRNIFGQSGLVFHRIKPEAGKLILFPNYVTHSVETNLSNDLRISVVLEFRFINNE